MKPNFLNIEKELATSLLQHDKLQEGQNPSSLPKGLKLKRFSPKQMSLMPNIWGSRRVFLPFCAARTAPCT